MDIFQTSSIWIYVFIFFGKIFEVSVSTIRLVLINRGERLKGSIIAVFEMLLWLFITGTVLVGCQDDILRLFVFAIAFAVGNYVGSWMEDKLAFGLCSLQLIVPESEDSQELMVKLRANNFAVTSVKGKGKDGDRDVMYLHIKRKRISKALEIIKANMENAVVVINDSKIVNGGFIRK
ncbi:MAG: DUF2179 domain-containing protein [Peptostreptococcaceae bacterium]|nr:DUF2179 domain-containing protein [Peptostreptococcaceae bacterium]